LQSPSAQTYVNVLCSPPLLSDTLQSVYWFFINENRSKMGKGRATFSLNVRKTRAKTLKQCFQVLFTAELGLKARAHELREQYLLANPDEAKKWAKTGKKSTVADRDSGGGGGGSGGSGDSKPKDPTSLVKYTTQALNEAWAVATDEQKAQAQAMWAAQYASEGDDHEEGGEIQGSTEESERRK
jgi:hypothetical protein